MALLAADALGRHGDTTAPDALPDYVAAFRQIAASPNDTLYVAELDGEVVGTFQTTMIISLLGARQQELDDRGGAHAVPTCGAKGSAPR